MHQLAVGKALQGKQFGQIIAQKPVKRNQNNLVFGVSSNATKGIYLGEAKSKLNQSLYNFLLHQN